MSSATASKRAPRAAKTSDRFVKLSATSKELSANAKDWAQVLDRETGLIWLAETFGARVAWEEAKSVAAACRVGGHEDWRLPTQKELLSLVDYARHSPAIDTDLFPATHSSWYWSSTPAAWAPQSFAWGVLFDYGFALYLDQSGTAFVRAVRVSRASQ